MYAIRSDYELDICMYQAGVQKGEVVDALVTQLRCTYGDAQCCLRVIAGDHQADAAARAGGIEFCDTVPVAGLFEIGSCNFV